MGEIKNKIITISGEPASGKSTVVKKLTEKYEDVGYHVHVISVGTLFREILVKKYIEAHPEVNEINLADLQIDAEFRNKIHQTDNLIDRQVVNIGIEINSKERPNDVYIVDSRLAWKNIPASYSVRLTVTPSIAGKRVFSDTTRGLEDQYTTLQQAIIKTSERKKSEIERYKKRYHVDLTDPNNYNLIIDTSYSNIDELASIILDGEKAYNSSDKKNYPKTWASPTCFMPLQLGKITGGASVSGNTIESLARDMATNGFDIMNGTLTIIEKDGIKYLLEGNHRTFAALSTGKTLLPYDVCHKDDKKANDIASSYLVESTDYMEYVYDYADGIRYYGGQVGNIEQLKNFTIKDLVNYNEIFDGIYGQER